MIAGIEDSPSRPAVAGITALVNLAQAGLLLAAFAGLLAAALTPMLGSSTALVVAGIVDGAIIILALRAPPERMLRFYGAVPYRSGDLAQLERITTELARRAGLRRPPKLFVMPAMSLSIFSIGTSRHFATVLTEGLLRRLTVREVAALLAREVAHAQRGDLPVFAVADLVTRCAQALYYLGLLLGGVNLVRSIGSGPVAPWSSVFVLVLAPIAVSFLQMLHSNARGMEVDRAAALLTGDPLGLASAIARLGMDVGRPYEELLPPVPARRVPLPSMLRLPPPPEPRIARLNAFAAPPMPPLDTTEGPRISLIGVGPIEMRPRYRWPGVWF